MAEMVHAHIYVYIYIYIYVYSIDYSTLTVPRLLGLTVDRPRMNSDKTYAPMDVCPNDCEVVHITQSTTPLIHPKKPKTRSNRTYGGVIKVRHQRTTLRIIRACIPRQFKMIQDANTNFRTDYIRECYVDPFLAHIFPPSFPRFEIKTQEWGEFCQQLIRHLSIDSDVKSGIIDVSAYTNQLVVIDVVNEKKRYRCDYEIAAKLGIPTYYGSELWFVNSVPTLAHVRIPKVVEGFEDIGTLTDSPMMMVARTALDGSMETDRMQHVVPNPRFRHEFVRVQASIEDYQGHAVDPNGWRLAAVIRTMRQALAVMEKNV
jgi:hypothetical protein